MCAGRLSAHHTQSLLQQGHERTPFLCQHASVSGLHPMCHSRSRSHSHLYQMQLQQWHSIQFHRPLRGHARVRHRHMGCHHFLPNHFLQLSVLHSRMQAGSRVISLPRSPLFVTALLGHGLVQSLTSGIRRKFVSCISNCLCIGPGIAKMLADARAANTTKRKGSLIAASIDQYHTLLPELQRGAQRRWIGTGWSKRCMQPQNHIRFWMLRNKTQCFVRLIPSSLPSPSKPDVLIHMPF